MRLRTFYLLLGWLLAGAPGRGLYADPSNSIVGQEPLEEYFQTLKKGTPLQLTLDKDRIVKGLFSSYDDYYQTVWIVPRGEKGLFIEKSYKLAGIRAAAPWDPRATAVDGSSRAAKSVSDDYYLLKDADFK